MKQKFKKIWDKALIYQDKRDDKGHAEIVTEYAIKLCEIENLNDEIVVPAAILHDIGWSQLSYDERFLIFNPNKTDEMERVVRIKHQEEGVILAEKILNEVNYSKQLIEMILEIISEHDTRKGFLSKEDGAMRDADKLWRFTRIGFDADLRTRKCSFQFYYDRLNNFLNSNDFLFFSSSKDIAKQELAKRKEDFISGRIIESTIDNS